MDTNSHAFSVQSLDDVLRAAKVLATTIPELESLIAQKKFLAASDATSDKLDETMAALLSCIEQIRLGIQEYRGV